MLQRLILALTLVAAGSSLAAPASAQDQARQRQFDRNPAIEHVRAQPNQARRAQAPRQFERRAIRNTAGRFQRGADFGRGMGQRFQRQGFGRAQMGQAMLGLGQGQRGLRAGNFGFLQEEGPQGKKKGDGPEAKKQKRGGDGDGPQGKKGKRRRQKGKKRQGPGGKKKGGRGGDDPPKKKTP